MESAETLTDWLAKWREGHTVHDRVMPMVYADLRRLAGRIFAHERPEHTLQATGLVSEAYIRLADGGPFDSREHFFGAAANAMRQTLVDYARRRAAFKRGSTYERVELDESYAALPLECREILDVENALACLEAKHPRRAELVKLRYFAGLSVKEAAKVLKISVSTAKDDWAEAKTWLQEQFKEQCPASTTQ